MIRRLFHSILATILLIPLVLSCTKEAEKTIPFGLYPIINYPPDNIPTPEKVELGKLLFFDKRLSKDGTISCASCHSPRSGWADKAPLSAGYQGRKGIRNAPTIVNSAYLKLLFRDGRVDSLEAQVLGPITGPAEMAHDSHSDMVEALKKIAGYRPFFKRAFGDENMTFDRIAKAIASFERTILAGNSKYDRYLAGDMTAMSESEVRGMNLFFSRANCIRCHVGPNLSDGDFHNLGIGMDKPKPDLGRYEITKDDKDKGAFKTPSLRDVSKHAPYMHDGSLQTLEEVIEFYDRGGDSNDSLSPRMGKLSLTAQEKLDLKAFLLALDSQVYPKVEEPSSLP